MSPASAPTDRSHPDVILHSPAMESLVRPLLELLHTVTGMASTYLTRVDETAGEQEVLYAHNSSADLQIPEQLTVPWGDTLCRRALEQDRMIVTDVAGCWGDVQAAAELGIVTYLSCPVRSSDGDLLGTLCAASPVSLSPTPDTPRLMAMFARLISQSIERDILIARLRQAEEALRMSADSDPLTGLPNRRALLHEIDRRLQQHAKAGTGLVLCFLDMDGFKAINDRYGHAVGDRFLAQMADKLRKGQRPEDYCARLGGDEFVTLTSLARDAGSDVELRLRQRLLAATSGRFDLGDGVVIDYPGASIGVTWANGDTHAIAMISRADAAMYQDKQRRRAEGGSIR